MLFTLYITLNSGSGVDLGHLCFSHGPSDAHAEVWDWPHFMRAVTTVAFLGNVCEVPYE